MSIWNSNNCLFYNLLFKSKVSKGKILSQLRFEPALEDLIRNTKGIISISLHKRYFLVEIVVFLWQGLIFLITEQYRRHCFSIEDILFFENAEYGIDVFKTKIHAKSYTKAQSSFCSKNFNNANTVLYSLKLL